MKNLISDLFPNVIKSVYSGRSFGVLKEAKDYTKSYYKKKYNLLDEGSNREVGGIYLKYFSKRFSGELSKKYNLRKVVNNLAKYGFFSKEKYDVYKVGNLTNIVLKEAQSLPIIRKLKERTNNTNYTEERVLLLMLNRGPLKINEIQPSLGDSNRNWRRGLMNLKKLKMITKVRSRIKFFKVEKKANMEDLNQYERLFYKTVSKNDNTRAKTIISKFKSSYGGSGNHLGYLNLYRETKTSVIRSGLISENYQETTFSMTALGISVARALNRINKATQSRN